MSQVIKKIEKFNTGGSAPNINKGRKFTVKVNGELMDIYEQDLNTQYESFLGDIGRKGNNKNDWNTDYNDLLNNIQNGMQNGKHFEFNVGANSANQIKYSGDLSNTDRGLDANGNPEKQGFIKNVLGGGVKNEAVRNSSLLNFLGNTIATSKNKLDQTTQAEYDAEQAKLKAEQEKEKQLEEARQLDKRQDIVNRFDFNNNFLSDYNGSDIDPKMLFNAYHSNPANQRGLAVGHLRRLKELSLNGSLDDQKTIDLYNQGRGFDLGKVRDYLRNVNLDDANLNLQSVYDNIGMGNDYRALQDRTVYEEMLQAKKLQQANAQLANDAIQRQLQESAAGVDTSAGTGTGSTVGGDATGQGTGEVDNSGNTSVESNFNFHGRAFDDYRNATGTYKGKTVTFGQIEDAYINGTDASPELKALVENSYNGELSNIAQDYQNSKDSWINPFDDSYWNGVHRNYNPYRFTDLNTAKTQLGDVQSYRDITNNFSHYDASKNAYRIVQEVLKDPTGKRRIPIVRQRVYGPNGVVNNAKLIQGNGFSFIQVGNKQLVKLGKYDPNLNNKHIVNYNYVKKNQYGGTINNKLQSTEFGSLVNDNYEMTEADYTEMAGLTADLVGLGISFAGPVGGLAAGAAGLGSTAARARAKALRGEDWFDGELAMDLGLDIATAIPIAGSLGKTYKIGRAIKRAMPLLERVLPAMALMGGGSAVYDSFTKIKNGDNSIENYTTLAKGLTALMAGKRGLTDKKLATTKGPTSKSVDVKVNGTTQKLNLTENQIKDLNLKDVESQKKMIQGLASKMYKVKPNVIDVPVDKQFGAKIFGKQIRGKELGVKVTETPGATILKAYNDNPTGIMQRLENRAIARQAGKYPELNQSEYEAVPIINVGKTYGKTSSNEEAISTLKSSDKAFTKEVANAERTFKSPDLTKNEARKNVSAEAKAPDKPNTEAVKNVTGSDKYKDSLEKINKTLSNLKISDEAKTAYAKGKTSTIKEELQNKLNNSTSIALKNKYQAMAKELDINLKVSTEAKKSVSESTKRAASSAQEKVARVVSKVAPKKEVVKTEEPAKKKRGRPKKEVVKAQTGLKFELPKLELVKPKIVLPDYSKMTLPGLTKQEPKVRELRLTGKTGSGVQEVGGKTLFNVNRTDLSEWARALANRRANSLLDTKVSTALQTAPIMPQVTVKGDILSSSAFSQNANRLRQTASTPLTSDGALMTASRLAAESKAGDYEVQGGLNNAQAIRQQEAQNNQILANDAAMRTQVANQNAQTLAAAEQAKRQNENAKQAAMFKSIDNAWARQNTISYGKEMQMQHLVNQQRQLEVANLPIDTNEFGDRYQGKTMSSALSEMLTEMNQNQTQMARPGITNEERTKLELRNRELSQSSERLKQYMQLKVNKALQNTPRYGDIGVTTPSYTKLNSNVVTRKSGGRVPFAEKVAIEEIRRQNKLNGDWFRQYSDYIKTKMREDNKLASEANRATSKLIEKAVGG